MNHKKTAAGSDIPAAIFGGCSTQIKLYLNKLILT